MLAMQVMVCNKQQELLGEVQRHLVHLSELAHAEAELVKSRRGDAGIVVDKEIEETMGRKERAIGALRQHREEHGC